MRTIERLKRFMIAAILMLLLVSPAYASSPFQLYSGAVTASGQSAAFDIRTNSIGWVTVDVTAASGTIVFDAWLEGSNDGGVTWEEIGHNGGNLTTGTASATAITAGRDIVDNKTSTAAARFSAFYPWLPMTKIRLAWTLSGSTPSVTFTARFGGK